MSVFPEFNNTLGNSDDTSTKGTKEIIFDFETKRVVILDGKVKIGSEVEQVKQWIELLILTQVDKFKVYKETPFGMTDLYGLIGHAYANTPFGISELTREIKEKIQMKKEVKEVINIKTESGFNLLTIQVTVLLKSGKTLESEVNI